MGDGARVNLAAEEDAGGSTDVASDGIKDGLRWFASYRDEFFDLRVGDLEEVHLVLEHGGSVKRYEVVPELLEHLVEEGAPLSRIDERIGVRRLRGRLHAEDVAEEVAMGARSERFEPARRNESAVPEDVELLGRAAQPAVMEGEVGCGTSASGSTPLISGGKPAGEAEGAA